MRPLRPQKYIYKLNSTYLDMHDYNVSLDLCDVAYNSEIVISVGHSQLIQWIEEETGTSDNYIEIQKIRKDIRDLKRRVNTTDNQQAIKTKYDDLYRLQFEPNLVSIQFDKKSHFDKCCTMLADDNGTKIPKLKINGKYFRRLYGTPGGLKMSTVLFISQDLYQPIYDKVTNGRNLSLEYTPAKLEAYMALTSSTSNPVSWPRMIVVNGTTVEFDADVIEVSDGINSNDPIVKKVENKRIKSEINDGCGIMTPEYSRRINREINGIDETVSGVCARCAFLKGMLFTFDFKEFAENVAHKTMITDAWGHERNVMDADIIVTTSQLKLWDAYENYEAYKLNCEKHGYEFRLTKISDELDESRNLNYQFTQSYYLSDDDIEELISPTVDEITDILSLDPKKSIVYLAGAGLNDQNVMKSDHIAKALMINRELINDPYVRSRIERMIQKKIRLAKISTIDVEGNFALISGDPYAMCEDIFGMKVAGLLGPGELYHQFWRDKNVKEVVCMRAPMCAHFNISKQNISYGEQAAYWFRYIKDCIILNSWDTLRIAESGADCDGDILFTTNNRILVDRHRQLPALDCQQRKAPKMLPTEENIAASNKKGFKNKVGSITNIGTSMLNLQSNFLVGSKEWDELEYRTICIQHFQQLSIDSVKGIKMTPMNDAWNKLSYCLPTDGDSVEVARAKEFNKRVCAYRKPFFMIYRYGTTKSQYDSYVKKVDSKLKQRYNISLDELLTNSDLSDDLQNERDRFYNRCPVDMSPGTVNRIAWAVNKKFDEFSALPKVPFDKETIKSGTEYNKSDYFKIRDIYKEYRDVIRNLAKKTKTDEVDEEEDGVTDKVIIDLLFKGKFYEACSNGKVLCDILIDMLYDKPNSKGVVWEMCGDVIIDNLLEKSGWMIEYPECVHEDEEFSCCRKKFKTRRISVRGEIDGEV